VKSLPKTVLLVPDVHVPFHDKRAWNLILKVQRILKPALTVQLGDFGDLYNASRHSRRPGGPLITLKEERTACRHEWRRLEDTSNELWFLGGNHDIRVSSNLLNKAPEMADCFGDIREFYNFDTAVTSFPYQQLVHIGKVALVHDVGKSGANATRDGLNSAQHCLINGHTHRLEMLYGGNIMGERHFSMSCGYVGDINSPAFDYANATVKRHWQLGMGWLRFIDGLCYATPIPMVNYTCVIEGRRYAG